MNSFRPTWLPEILQLNGDWENIVKKLYEIFKTDFIFASRKFEGRQIDWDRRKLDSKYEEGFWHLISQYDERIGDRIPDFRRAERLPWCGPTITNCKDISIKIWDYVEKKKKIRTYLWLEKFDYVVVLEKRKKGNVVILVTAYYVSGDSTRRSLLRKYNEKLD